MSATADTPSTRTKSSRSCFIEVVATLPPSSRCLNGKPRRCPGRTDNASATSYTATSAGAWLPTKRSRGGASSPKRTTRALLPPAHNNATAFARNPVQWTGFCFSCKAPEQIVYSLIRFFKGFRIIFELLCRLSFLVSCMTTNPHRRIIPVLKGLLLLLIERPYLRTL
jgi:hypothetical protein